MEDLVHYVPPKGDRCEVAMVTMEHDDSIDLTVGHPGIDIDLAVQIPGEPGGGARLHISVALDDSEAPRRGTWHPVCHSTKRIV
jgi:hypothetical protein